jgi:type VI secretion system ImpM family protein
MRHASDIVCFGKLPTHGDFIRHNAEGTAARWLDTWFREGLHRMRARQPEDLPTGGGASVPYRFVLSPTTDGALLIGVLQMSRDRAGRPYPFVVAAEQARTAWPGPALAQLPDAADRFLTEAETLVQKATSGLLERNAMLERLAGLSLDAIRAAREADGEADPWGNVAFRAFAEAIWPAFEDSRKYVLFRNLTDILLPLRGAVPARFSLGLRFPLPTPAESREEPTAARPETAFTEALEAGTAPSLRAGDAKTAGPGTPVPEAVTLDSEKRRARQPARHAVLSGADVVGIWLRLAQAFVGTHSAVPTFFWPSPAARGQHDRNDRGMPRGEGDAASSSPRGPTLLLFFRPPPASALAHLLAPHVAGDTVCALETEGGANAARAALSIPARIGRLLESESVSLSTFLRRLA